VEKQPKPNFRVIVELLASHNVEFIVVGGIAAVLQGAPVSTFDLDLVHARTPENIERLLPALPLLQAHYRERGIQHLVPNASLLASAGLQLLQTKYELLDLLGTIHEGETYEELVPQCVWVQLGTASVRVLGLEKVLQWKRRSTRDKDKEALAALEKTLKENRRGDR